MKLGEQPQVMPFASFLTLCHASPLAEACRLSSLLQGSSPAKTRGSSKLSHGPGHHLGPSTKCSKLSGCRYRRLETCPAYSRRWRRCIVTSDIGECSRQHMRHLTP